MGLGPGQVDESEVITPTAMVKTFCFGELACRRDHDRRKYVSVLYPTFFTARRSASARMLWLCLSVHLSQVGVLQKRLTRSPPAFGAPPHWW